MNNDKNNPDIFGKAMKAFFLDADEEEIVVQSPDFDDDHIPLPYLFRDLEEMPPLEKAALKKCSGKILDVGCGAGSHSMYLQEERKLSVTAIDTSPGAIEVCRLRGIRYTRNVAFEDLSGDKFDTILLLMNGTGIVGRLNKLDDFFRKLRELLNPEGQVLIDSSDLSYLFVPDEDGGIWVNAADGYYGELKYRLMYKGETSSSFDWLYLDFNSLSLAASKNGFNCELLKEGEHYDYLAKLTINL